MRNNFVSVIFATISFLLMNDIAVAYVQHKPTKSYGHSGSLSSIIHSMLPNESIEIKQVKNAVILSGTVSSTEVADKAVRLANEYVSHSNKVLNFMKVKTSQQVMLRVRVGEVIADGARVVDTENFGFEDLEQRGLVKLVAEPNLVAISGEKAEFLSGGEFPIPASQKDGAISVDYKPYGVKLSFLPVVLSSNRIRLNVEQEISELSKKGTITIAGMNIPAVNARRAKTTIELAPGEAFMIAGLVRDEIKNNRRWSNELVISVTPYLVDPVTNKNIRFPTNDRYVPTALEKKFIEKVNDVQKVSVNEDTNFELEGPVGFIAE